MLKSRLWNALWGWIILFNSSLWCAQTNKGFVFANSSLIIMAEVGGKSEVIINVINLSDSLVVLEAKNLVITNKNRGTFAGQVIELAETDNKGNTWKYRASVLVQPKSALGFSIFGAFGDLAFIDSVALRIGGRVYSLEGISASDFNGFAQRVSEIDLKAADSKQALAAVNVQSVGKVTNSTGSAEDDAPFRDLTTADGINSPKIVSRTLPTYTAEAQKQRVQGTVKIAGTITKNGDLFDAKVVKSLGHGLDERALEVVRNSWKFLPATKNGEVVESTVTIEVEFRLPE